MNLRYAGLALATGMGIAILGSAGPARSQEVQQSPEAQETQEARPEISESHMRTARRAVAAIGATNEFDSILPQAAMALKSELVQKNPNMERMIDATVDEKALALAPRRADLEREAATAFATVFSEEELSAITEFYASEAGQKLIEQGPVVTREVLRAADIWQQGVARDLAQQVGASLQEQTQGEGQAAD